MGDLERAVVPVGSGRDGRGIRGAPLPGAIVRRQERGQLLHGHSSPAGDRPGRRRSARGSARRAGVASASGRCSAVTSLPARPVRAGEQARSAPRPNTSAARPGVEPPRPREPGRTRRAPGSRRPAGAMDLDPGEVELGATASRPAAPGPARSGRGPVPATGRPSRHPPAERTRGKTSASGSTPRSRISLAERILAHRRADDVGRIVIQRQVEDPDRRGMVQEGGDAQPGDQPGPAARDPRAPRRAHAPRAARRLASDRAR